MGCFSGCLMSSASDQKLFCGVCSAFKRSFDEFVGEKVVSPSYSYAILVPPSAYVFWSSMLLKILSTSQFFPHSRNSETTRCNHIQTPSPPAPNQNFHVNHPSRVWILQSVDAYVFLNLYCLLFLAFLGFASGNMTLT